MTNIFKALLSVVNQKKIQVGKVVSASGKTYTLQDHGGATFTATSSGTHSTDVWVMVEDGKIVEELPNYLNFYTHYVQ